MELAAARRRMLTFGLIPVVALVLGGGMVTISTIPGQLGFEYLQDFAPSAGGVSIASDVPVAVIVSVDGMVHVRAEGSYTNNRPVASATTTGDRLDVGMSCHGSDGCRVDLVVEMPADLPLSVRTTQASIGVMKMSGPLRIDATDGPVDAVDLSSRTVSVETHSGSVQLFFRDPPTTVDATTSNGSLRVDLPVPAAYAISTAADQGSSEISVPNDLSARRRLNLRSTNGSITVNGTQQR